MEPPGSVIGASLIAALRCDLVAVLRMPAGAATAEVATVAVSLVLPLLPLLPLLLLPPDAADGVVAVVTVDGAAVAVAATDDAGSAFMAANGKLLMIRRSFACCW